MTVTPLPLRNSPPNRRRETRQVFSRESWGNHLRDLAWKQGEHVLIAGPTSSGKTTLAASLVRKRSHVIICVSKITDRTFDREYPSKDGWTRVERWPKGGLHPWHTKVLLWPRQQRTLRETLYVQRDVFGEALDALAREGNRCVVIDESLMFSDPKFIGKGPEVSLMHYYGRSAGLSMVDLTQRPAWIPNVIYSSVTHAYIARTRDKNDLKRLSDMGGIDPVTVGRNVAGLSSRHDYVYLNPQGDAPPSVVNTRK